MGRRKSEVYQHIVESEDAEGKARWAEHFAQLRAREPFSNFQQRWTTPSGQTRHLLNSGKPFFSSEGRFLGYRGVAADITDIIRAQEAIRESEKRYRTLIDTVPAIVLALRPDGCVEYANKHFENLTGHRLDDIVGKNWFKTFLVPDEAGDVKQVFDRAIGGSSTHRNVNAILTRSGEQVLIEWSDNLVRDSSGGVELLIAIGTDVTEQVRAEKAREEEYHRLKSILDGMYSFVGLFDTEGRMLETNEAPLKGAGLSRDGVVGRFYWDTCWFTHCQDARAKIKAAILTAAQGKAIRDDFSYLMNEDHVAVVDTLFNPSVGSARQHRRRCRIRRRRDRAPRHGAGTQNRRRSVAPQPEAHVGGAAHRQDGELGERLLG